MKRKLAVLWRLFLLTLIALIGLAIWRPDWRIAAERAAQRAAAPYLEREARSLAERARSWRRTPGQPPPDKASPATPPAAERTLGSREETDRSAPAARRPAPSETPESGGAPDQPTGTERDRHSLESTPAPEDEAVAPSGDLPPRLPKLSSAPLLPASLRSLQEGVRAHPSAAGYRRLADAAAAGFPEVAATAYQCEARIYRRQGDPNAALVEELKAGRYHSEAQLFLHDAGDEPPAPPHPARLEPAYGALLGAFIDRDDQLENSFFDENWQTHRDPQEFGERVGKPPATLFCYLRYGQPFPRRWAERLRDEGVIPHIAWEPRSLAEVSDDRYLERFADALARFDAPIFIRFAGEMNGDWTPYHSNPALYRQKFRLVHQVIARRAPNAALIWCVNSVPMDGIDAYYPGDDAVDWVGVNLYNVIYFDNVRSRPATRVHPVDLLQPIYARYASRKPIALCEYAASHRAAADPHPYPGYAATRLAQMYAALPRLFPRVKLVDWFDCDNLQHARPDRQLNDYSLTDDPAILQAYRQAVAPDYFLGRPDDHPQATIRPLRADEPLSGIVTLSGWVRTYLDRPHVYLLADDQVLYAGDAPGAPVARWDTRRAPPGSHTLRLIVADGSGRKILEERRRVRVSEGA